MTHSTIDSTLQSYELNGEPEMMSETDAANAQRFLEHEALQHDGDARRLLCEAASYLGQQAKNGVPTGVEAEVCALVAQRQRAGIAKYGMTVADNPLALRDWLQHALEEVLDQAVYLKRAINELEVLQPLVVTGVRAGSMTLDAPGRIGLKGLFDIHYDVEPDEFVVLVKVAP